MQIDSYLHWLLPVTDVLISREPLTGKLTHAAACMPEGGKRQRSLAMTKSMLIWMSCILHLAGTVGYLPFDVLFGM